MNLRKNKKIHTTAFARYFYLQVPVKEVPDQGVLELIRSWGGEDVSESEIFKEFLEFQRKKQLTELLEKLYSIFLGEIGQEVALKLIRCIYRNSDKLLRSNSGLWNSEFDRAEYLTLNLLNERVKDDLIERVVEEILTRTDDFYFASVFLLSISPSRQNSFYKLRELLKHAKLVELFSKRLNIFFIERNKNIFKEVGDNEWSLILYQWATSWGAASPKNKDEVNKYLQNLFKSDTDSFYKFIKSFAVTATSSTNKNKMIFRLNDYINVYDFRWVRNYALDHQNEDYINEFLNALISYDKEME